MYCLSPLYPISAQWPDFHSPSMVSQPAWPTDTICTCWGGMSVISLNELIYIWLLLPWTKDVYYLSLNPCPLTSPLNQRLVLFYTFIAVESLPALTAIMEFRHQKERRFWDSSLVVRRKWEGSEGRKHFRSAQWHCLHRPFHCCIREEDELRSRQIIGAQAWRRGTKPSFCWKLWGGREIAFQSFKCSHKFPLKHSRWLYFPPFKHVNRILKLFFYIVLRSHSQVCSTRTQEETDKWKCIFRWTRC